MDRQAGLGTDSRTIGPSGRTQGQSDEWTDPEEHRDIRGRLEERESKLPRQDMELPRERDKTPRRTKEDEDRTGSRSTLREEIKALWN